MSQDAIKDIAITFVITYMSTVNILILGLFELRMFNLERFAGDDKK